MRVKEPIPKLGTRHSATIPSPPLWIPAFAGMTKGGRNDEGGPRMINESLADRSVPDRSPRRALHSNDELGGRNENLGCRV